MHEHLVTPLAQGSPKYRTEICKYSESTLTLAKEVFYARSVLSPTLLGGWKSGVSKNNNVCSSSPPSDWNFHSLVASDMRLPTSEVRNANPFEVYTIDSLIFKCSVVGLALCLTQETCLWTEQVFFHTYFSYISLLADQKNNWEVIKSVSGRFHGLLL